MEQILECKICLDDLDTFNTCMYCTDKNPTLWRASEYCIDCARDLRSAKYHNYIDDIKKSKCKTELTRLLKSGPPKYIIDRGFPVDAGEEVSMIRVAGQEPETARYDDVPDDEEYMEIWHAIITVIQPCLDELDSDDVGDVVGNNVGGDVGNNVVGGNVGNVVGDNTP